MAENPIEIEREIVQQREALDSHVQELEAKIGEVSDWRTYMRQRPLAIAAAVFSAGVVLAFLFMRSRYTGQMA